MSEEEREEIPQIKDTQENTQQTTTMPKFTLDEILNLTGEFGVSQRIYLVCLLLLQFFVSFHMLLTVFSGLEPSFICYTSNVADKTHQIGKNVSLSNECVDNDVSKCHSIVYTTQYTSFAAEWDLICNEKYKVALVQSVWMGGVMCGALVLGGVADIIGRLRTLMLALLGTIAFEGFSGFSPTYIIMIVLRFFGGICCALVILVSFVLSQEFVGSKWRSFCGIGLSMAFASGIAIFAGLAAAVTTWRILTVICSLSGVIFLLMPCYMPESPRWLLSQGDVKEAKIILQGMAKINGTLNKLPTQWDLLSGNKIKEKKAPGIGLLFTNNYVTLLVFILIFSWFINSATYYGLTMAASDLGGDVYISTALNGLIEIPAGLIALAIIDRIGRRFTLSGFMIVGGIACLFIQVVPQSLVIVTTTLALVGKLSISASFAACYIHSAEIFPTVIRNSGMGLVSVAARVGGMLAPFILMLGEIYPNLQFSALGLFTLLAGVLNLKLPETAGKPMPETVADILTLRGKHHVSIKKKSRYKYDKLENMEEEEVWSRGEVQRSMQRPDKEARSRERSRERSSSPVSPGVHKEGYIREDKVPLMSEPDF